MLPRVLLFVFILVCSSLATYGQPLRFQHYSINQGLSQSSVRSVFKDSIGFIWLATQDGLNRFDGKNFKSWKRNTKEHTSISENFITLVTADQNGDLWIGTVGGGINIYNGASDSISWIGTNGDTSTTLRTDNVYTMLMTSQKEIWAGTDNGVAIFDPATHQLVDVVSNFKVSAAVVTCIAEDKMGRVWIGTRHDGVYIHDAKTRKRLRHLTKMDLNLSDQRVDQVRHIQCDSETNAWISTDNGLFVGKLSQDSLQLHKITLSTGYGDFTNEVVMCTTKDHLGQLWIGTQNGLLIGNEKNTSFQRYTHDINNPYSLTDRVILCIYEDREQVMWIGTYNGVNKYVYEPANIRSYTSDIRDRTKNVSVVRSLYTEDDVNIFVGTVNGLCYFNCQTETFTEVHDKNGQNLQNVFCVTRDLDGTLWAGNSNGLQRIMPRAGSLTVDYPPDHQELEVFRDLEVTQLVPLTDDKYLIATYAESGLAIWDKARHTVEHIKYDASRSDGLLSNKVNYIAAATSGRYWIASNRGLNLFDKETNTFKSFDPGGTETYPALRVVNAIHVNGDTLWLATNGGLIRFVPGTNSSTLFTEDDGLSNNNLYSCLPINDSVLWMSSNKGLSQFNTKTLKFNNYDLSDGLQSNEYNRYASFKSAAGRLYFGGMEGFDVIEEKSDPLKLPSPVVVTSIRIIDNNQFAEHYPAKHHRLELEHTQNAIGFTYAALDFSLPKRNNFLCKLEGFDNQWIDNGTNTSFSYTNLPPGNYVFKVKLKDDVGSPGTSYPFTILTPFWQAKWFIGIIAVSMVVILAYLIQTYYNNKLEKQRMHFEKRQAVQHERTRIATDMHDDLGAGLSRIKFLSESIGIKSQNQQLIGDDVVKIKEYAHEMIDKMGEIVWALNEKNDSLMDLLSFTRAYAAEYLQQHNLESSITAPEELPLTFVSGEFRRNVFLTVKEALHNIIKHASASHVKIDITIESELQIAIQDNGRGFNKREIRPYSNGISNMQSRLKNIGGRLEINGEHGTAVLLTVPIQA